jgi:hypothetical protein
MDLRNFEGNKMYFKFIILSSTKIYEYQWRRCVEEYFYPKNPRKKKIALGPAKCRNGPDAADILTPFDA